MTHYKDLKGNSGIQAYELGAESIIIQFKAGGKYLYNHHQPGADKVTRMTELAVSGAGLGTYINKYVRDDYAAKIG